MKQKTAAIKFLRTKIAAGYVLILILKNGKHLATDNRNSHFPSVSLSLP